MPTRASIDWQVKILSAVESTQDIVMLAAQDGDPEGYVVQAMKQVGGRGRHGNKWEGSSIGNIYMSALLRPSCDIPRVGELAFVVAVALYNALQSYIDTDKHEITLKWPNDILIDGRKVSGILLETNANGDGLDGLVVGMGVNVFNAPDLAICLNDVADDPVYVTKIRDKILEELGVVYTLWQEEGFAPIREQWLAHAHGVGQAMTARLPNISHKGIFSGLTDDGSLILTQDNGEEKIIMAGDVHFGEST